MRTLAIILCGLAFLLSITATIDLLNAPSYQYIETVYTESGKQYVQGTATLVEVNGTWVVYQLVVVILVSGVPLFFALRQSASQSLVTWVSTLLLMAYSIAGSMTVGLYFMPSAILLLIAAVITLFIRKDGDLRPPATILSGLAFLIFVAGTIYLLNASFYEHIEGHCTGHCDANNHCTESCDTIQDRITLVEVHGPGFVIQLVLVTLVSSIPLFTALRRSASQRLVTWVSALLILAYSIAGRSTNGLVFIPGAILLLIVAVVTLFIRKDATPVKLG